mgnify:CR=1 FL=1
MEDVETDIDVGLDNLRREIDKLEQNGGKSLSEEDERRMNQFTKPIDFEAKEVDFGKMRSTSMRQNKYFEMARPVNRRDELRLQTLKTRLLETTKEVIKKTNDEKGMPRSSCFTEQEAAGIKSLVKRRKDEGLVICGTDKSQSCGAMSEENWLASLEPHTKNDQVVTMDEVDSAERKMMGMFFSFGSFFILAQTSYPSIPGMLISSRIKSTGWRSSSFIFASHRNTYGPPKIALEHLWGHMKLH